MKTILIKKNQSVGVEEYRGFKGLCDYYQGFPSTVNLPGLGRPFCMVVDDAGLLLGLAVNHFASKLYGTEIHGRPIVGDVFLLKQKWGPDGYDLVGLTDSEVDILVKRYGLQVE